MCYGEVISDTILRSRGKVRCSECNDPITRGDEYRQTVVKDGGEFDRTRVCLRCAAAHEVVRDATGEACVMFGESSAELRERARSDGWRSVRRELRAAMVSARAMFDRLAGRKD